MIINRFKLIFELVVLCLLTASCSTGIEGTKRVTPNRDDRRLLRRTPEELLIDSISATPLSRWYAGKEFLITDNKASLIYNVSDSEGNRTHNDSLAGRKVAFVGISSVTNPAGKNIALIQFRDIENNNLVTYSSSRDVDDAGSMNWNDFPMLVDLELVNEFRKVLSGRKLWIRTPLWYDHNAKPVSGTKFTPVVITDVLPGNAVFPLSVAFKSGETSACVPMNISDGKSSYTSRSFPSLFYLNDPKDAHPNISDDVWNLICNGRLAIGMTKEECKLSIGNPQEVENGHNWDVVVDYWRYENGTYLLFVDDRLSEFKQ